MHLYFFIPIEVEKIFYNLNFNFNNGNELMNILIFSI